MFVGVFEEQGGIPGLWDENVRKIRHDRVTSGCRRKKRREMWARKRRKDAAYPQSTFVKVTD